MLDTSQYDWPVLTPKVVLLRHANNDGSPRQRRTFSKTDKYIVVGLWRHFSFEMKKQLLSRYKLSYDQVLGWHKKTGLHVVPTALKLRTKAEPMPSDLGFSAHALEELTDSLHSAEEYVKEQQDELTDAHLQLEDAKGEVTDIRHRIATLVTGEEH